MKKICLLIFVTILFMNIPVRAIGVSAMSAVVIDAVTGEVLYEKNADEMRGMASTTKIMTAIVALEKGKTDDIVKISEKASRVEGSSMYLKAGEKISLGNLIYGLMLVSGNDAATAIAEHIARSEEKFAEMMNKKAREIGVNSTHFTNPHGLSDEEHYTTAKDLAKITAYGLKNPVFAEIVKTKSITIEREKLGKTILVNHNKLLKTYDGCIGVKTGFTKATGRCLVSAAERNGVKIVCVTLNAGDDWNDHRNLCDSIFESYRATLYQRGGTVAKIVKVKDGALKSVGGIYKEDIRLTERGDGEWDIYMEVPDTISAPVNKGEAIGKATATHKSGRKMEFDIIAEKDVAKRVENDNNRLSEKLKEVYINWLCLFCER